MPHHLLRPTLTLLFEDAFWNKLNGYFPCKFLSQHIFPSFVCQELSGVSKKMADTVTDTGGYILRWTHLQWATSLYKLLHLIASRTGDRIWLRWWDVIPLTRYLHGKYEGIFAFVGTVYYVLITKEIILSGPDIFKWKPLKDGLCSFVRLFLNGFEEVKLPCCERACEKIMCQGNMDCPRCQ